MSGRGEELGRRWLERAAWLALAVAFSPVIVDTVESVSRDPTDAYAPLVIVLVALAARGAERGRPRPGSTALLAVGLALEVVGIAGGTWSLARVGVPIAIIGLAARFGHPPPRVAALALFSVPLPDFLASMHVEPVAGALGRAVAACLPGVEATGPLLRAGARTLDLGAQASLLVLAHECAALGWYRAVDTGAGPSDALRRAGGAMLFAPLLAAAGALAAGVALLAERPHHGTGAVPAAVAVGPPLLVALYTTLRRTERAHPARSSAAGEPSIRV